MIIDYSNWRPAMADLAAVNGVIRYLSRDSAKHATGPELAELHQAGIATALVFEDGAERATGGAAAGWADGEFAATQAAALGVPRGRCLWTAVDFDVPDYDPASTDPLAKLGPVGAYLRAFASAIADAAAVGPYEAGAYGGYWLVRRALDARLVRRAWQTVAWSGTHIEARCALFQPGVPLHGGQADLDLAGWRDWGQFRRDTVMLAGPQA